MFLDLLALTAIDVDHPCVDASMVRHQAKAGDPLFYALNAGLYHNY